MSMHAWGVLGGTHPAATRPPSREGMGRERRSTREERDAAYRARTKKGGKGRNPCLLVSEPCYEVRLVAVNIRRTAIRTGQAVTREVHAIVTHHLRDVGKRRAGIAPIRHLD